MVPPPETKSPSILPSCECPAELFLMSSSLKSIEGKKKSTGCLKFYAAQAASVAHRIAFGPNAGQPIRRLKTQTRAIYGTPSHLG